MSIYPWIYYGLDGSNKQHFVWNGMQNAADSLLDSRQEYMRFFNGKNVFFYPTEYNTFSNQLDYKYKFDTLTGNWIKNYYIYDHLGSVRSVIINHDVLSNHIYKAYGEQLDISETRLGYIGQEKDKESLLGDHGVRKFSYLTGRFNSIDPLWEKYYSWSPYHYSRNNPVMRLDINGKNDAWGYMSSFAGDVTRSFGQLLDDTGMNYVLKWGGISLGATVVPIATTYSIEGGSYNFDLNSLKDMPTLKEAMVNPAKNDATDLLTKDPISFQIKKGGSIGLGPVGVEGYGKVDNNGNVSGGLNANILMFNAGFDVDNTGVFKVNAGLTGSSYIPLMPGVIHIRTETNLLIIEGTKK